MLQIKLDKKNLIIIISLGIFLILMIILYFYLLGENREKNLELVNLNNDINITKSNLQIVKNNRTDRNLSKEENFPLIIERITNTGRNLPIDFKSINPKEVRSIEDGYVILPLQMEIIGRYEHIGHFFGKIENLRDTIITIDNFNIKYDEKIQPKVLISVNLNIHLFRK